MSAPEIEIQQEIERTREHLGDTVEELTSRADVRARAPAKATEIKDRAAEAAGAPHAPPPPGGGAAPPRGARSSSPRPSSAGAAARPDRLELPWPGKYPGQG